MLCIVPFGKMRPVLRLSWNLYKMYSARQMTSLMRQRNVFAALKAPLVRPLHLTMPTRKRADKAESASQEGARLRRSGRNKGSTNGTPHHSKTDPETVKPEGIRSPPRKRTKREDAGEQTRRRRRPRGEYQLQESIIERGHIYFFYRPKVEIEEVSSYDDVRNLHILLVPRPPLFSVLAGQEEEGNAAGGGSSAKKEGLSEMEEMKVLEPGADAVPAPVSRSTSGGTQEKQKWRLITVGKKQMPVPRHVSSDDDGGGPGGDAENEAEQGAIERTMFSRKKGVFWATVTGVGDNLKSLEGLGESTYETKTRGTRHQGPARLLARGAYAIVNRQPGPPSSRVSHLGYFISHPQPEHFGEVQQELGIVEAAGSFLVQVKNPLAPANIPIHTKPAQYPRTLMRNVFGTAESMLERVGGGDEGQTGEPVKEEGGGDETAVGTARSQGNTKGREIYGLRFTACETPELLDYEGAQLLLIASRGGLKGVDIDLGEGRGEAMQEIEEKEGEEYNIQDVLDELGLEVGQVYVEPLEGKWI